jgi:hypothetical protein
MVLADVVTVADTREAVSQLGVVIEYFTLPNVELSVYLNDDGEDGPPCVPEAVLPVAALDGTLLPGQPAMNPGGRPRTAIEELRARLLPRLPEFMDGLIELSKSPNESTRLAAIREILDRLLGKPAVFVHATHTNINIGELYLRALQRANGSGNTSTIGDGNSINGSVGTASDPTE